MAKSFPTVATGPKNIGFSRGNRSSSDKPITKSVASGTKQLQTKHPQERPVTKTPHNLV